MTFIINSSGIKIIRHEKIFPTHFRQMWYQTQMRLVGKNRINEIIQASSKVFFNISVDHEAFSFLKVFFSLLKYVFRWFAKILKT